MKLDIEDLIEEEEVVITLNSYGYIKRMPADTYKPQKRGGKGISMSYNKRRMTL